MIYRSIICISINFTIDLISSISTDLHWPMILYKIIMNPKTSGIHFVKNEKEIEKQNVSIGIHHWHSFILFLFKSRINNENNHNRSISNWVYGSYIYMRRKCINGNILPFYWMYIITLFVITGKLCAWETHFIQNIKNKKPAPTKLFENLSPI